eukprot:gene12216-13473_t
MAISQSQWRKFNFFEREVLKDPSTDQPFDKFKGLEITSTASGRGNILVGDNEGSIFVLDAEQKLSFFKAYEFRVGLLFQLKQHNILVSVGEDEKGANNLIKVWNFDKIDKNGVPFRCKTYRAIVGSKNVSVSAISVHENLSQMAIGFYDGTVLIVRGDVTRERQSRQRNLHQDKYPVTGLAYKQIGSNVIIFVTTTETVTSYNLSAKDRREQLDEFGCNFKCSAISEVSQENQFVIARTDALYFYQPEGRGPCLAFEGEKKIVCCFHGYLVVVSKDVKQLPRAGMSMNVLTVYDTQNKFIAYTAPFPEILDVLGEWRSLHIITQDGKVFRLEEKDTQTKLETLFKKNMYDMAISLAKSHHYSDGLVEIFRQYGDHLYSKGNHDGAIDQYIRTIGHLEASYVIRKFLDAQRIHNLTRYLQALHEKGLANTDHTTLLLNCYTKLKAIDKLSDFIQSDKELNFDVETAIKVCRQAGYFTHALKLADKFNQHDWYLKIQLEDIKNYKNALKYISNLNFVQAEANLKSYGKTLMNEEPDETTDLLKRLCSDYKPVSTKSTERVIEDADRTDTDTSIVFGLKGITDLAHKTAAMVVSNSEPLILRAKPDEFIHIFVHKKQKLVEFLEYVIKIRNDCSNVVYNTLIEIYLHNASKAAQAKDFITEAEQENKCLSLFTNSKSKYDLDHALVLAKMHNFKKGILYLYEEAKLFQQILRNHMEHSEHDCIIDDCKKYGFQDPSLWTQALSYFARREEDCRKYITEVLDHIAKYNLLSPLLVIQALAHNSTATLAVIKDYIVRRLQDENEQIAKDERLIRQYRDDTEKMRNQIEELKTCAKIFQSSKCMICCLPLELPAVHFLCGDSFHQSCFESYAENDSECPVCVSENRKVMDIIKAQENNKDLHEQFHHQLERSADGFSVVADYFGRGVFKKVTVLTDPGTQQPIVQTDPSMQREKLIR